MKLHRFSQKNHRFSKRNVLGSESLHILYESKTKPNFAFHDADICSDATDQFIIADGEEHLAIKHPYPFIPKDSLLVQGQEENQGKQTNPGSPGKRPLKCRWALANNSYICKKKLQFIHTQRRMCTKFGTSVGVANVITCDKFFGDRLRGVDSVGG